MQRALRWIAIGGAAFLVVVAIVAGVGSRTETLRRLVIETLAERFAIHHLVMTGVGVHQRMPFEAELTNPIPRGLIKTSGRFGPWNRESPGGTPLDGKYLFDKADLSTIKGIGGILTSTGQFKGELERISVKDKGQGRKDGH